MSARIIPLPDLGDGWRATVLTMALDRAPRRFSRPLTWRDVEANDQALIRLPARIQPADVAERLSYASLLVNAKAWLLMRRARRYAQLAGRRRLQVVS